MPEQTEEEETGQNLVAKALGEFVAGELGDDGPARLIGACIQQNYNDYAWTMNSLMDSYKYSLALERATVQLLTARVAKLCSQPWVPNPVDILEALETWRYSEQIERLAEKLLKDL